MPKPRVFIQMSGAPGSGKSSLAGLLQPNLQAVVIDHDIIRSSLLQNCASSFDNVASKSYSLQWALAEDLLKQGHSIIVDSTCNFQTVIESGTSLADEYGLAYWYIECCVNDIELLDERLRRRAALISQRTCVDAVPEAARNDRSSDDARAIFAQWIDSPCRPISSTKCIILDASTGLEEQKAVVLGRIGEE